MNKHTGQRAAKHARKYEQTNGELTQRSPPARKALSLIAAIAGEKSPFHKQSGQRVSVRRLLVKWLVYINHSNQLTMLACTSRPWINRG
jgi:hypothetical protein